MSVYIFVCCVCLPISFRSDIHVSLHACSFACLFVSSFFSVCTVFADLGSFSQVRSQLADQLEAEFRLYGQTKVGEFCLCMCVCAVVFPICFEECSFCVLWRLERFRIFQDFSFLLFFSALNSRVFPTAHFGIPCVILIITFSLHSLWGTFSFWKPVGSLAYARCWWFPIDIL